MPEDNTRNLDDLLKRTQDTTWSPLPDELNVLIDAFLPTHPSDVRSKGYIVLSAVCQHYRGAYPQTDSTPDTNPCIDAISRALSPPVVAKLGDVDETAVLGGLSFLAALFQVEWQAASAILQRDGTIDCIADTLDIFAQSLPIARAVAQLISQAAGHKPCRAIIPPQCVEWLEAKSRRSNDSALRAAAAVALVKLARGAEADAAAIKGTADASTRSTTDDELVKLMKDLIISNPTISTLDDAVEGLAYLSVDSSVKEQLSKDTQFLSSLIRVIPTRKQIASATEDTTSSPVYGAVAIIANICAFRPRLSEEESQIAKLKRMAGAQKGKNSQDDHEEDPLDDDEHVKERCRRMISAGALGALASAVKITEGRATRLAAGKALLCMIEEQQNRGKVLQAGGAKVLLTIIQGILSAASNTSEGESLPSLERADIEPIQALAKLCITASPVQVFGPNEGALYDAIRPLAVMLLHPSSNLLQRFEALMALTNVASFSPEAATRVASSDGLLNKVELLMLEDHTMVRRAATELICNLIGGSEAVFNRYGGDKNTGSKSKLHVLVALCDVDDTPTRLAASGAIATLTMSPDGCQFLLDLQREKRRVLPILGQLIDPSVRARIVEVDEDDEDEDDAAAGRSEESHPGLVHRGAVCVRNLLVGVNSSARKELSLAARDIGLAKALVELVKSGIDDPGNAAVRPAAEALKAIVDSGVAGM